MSEWQRKIVLNPEWDQCNNYEIGVNELCVSVVNKLKALKKFNIEDIDMELEDLIDQFNDLSLDEEVSFSAFNVLMNELYDWGDTVIDGTDVLNSKRVCWIDTLTVVENESKVSEN